MCPLCQCTSWSVCVFATVRVSDADHACWQSDEPHRSGQALEPMIQVPRPVERRMQVDNVERVTGLEIIGEHVVRVGHFLHDREVRIIIVLGGGTLLASWTSSALFAHGALLGCCGAGSRCCSQEVGRRARWRLGATERRYWRSYVTRLALRRRAGRTASRCDCT